MPLKSLSLLCLILMILLSVCDKKKADGEGLCASERRRRRRCVERERESGQGRQDEGTRKRGQERATGRMGVISGDRISFSLPFTSIRLACLETRDCRSRSLHSLVFPSTDRVMSEMSGCPWLASSTAVVQRQGEDNDGDDDDDECRREGTGPLGKQGRTT